MRPTGELDDFFRYEKDGVVVIGNRFSDGWVVDEYIDEDNLRGIAGEIKTKDEAMAIARRTLRDMSDDGNERFYGLVFKRAEVL